jgi:hypothetical protein
MLIVCFLSCILFYSSATVPGGRLVMASSTLAWISLAVVITGIVLISLGLFLRSLARPWRRQLTHFRAGI